MGGHVRLAAVRGGIAGRADRRGGRRVSGAPEPVPMNGEGRPTARHVAVLVLKVALSAGLMAFLFSRVPLASLGATLKDVDRTLLAVAWFVLFASNVLASYQ